MAKLKDVVAVTGKYKDKEGNDKAKYTNCGAIIESNGKQYLVMEVMPAPVVGKDGVPKWFLHLYEPQEHVAKPKPAATSSGAVAGNDFNDDIPF